MFAAFVKEFAAGGGFCAIEAVDKCLRYDDVNEASCFAALPHLQLLVIRMDAILRLEKSRDVGEVGSGS